jgi:DNA-binding MarR family transcriptional regulator
VTNAPLLSGQDIGTAAAATRPLLDRIIQPEGLSFEAWVVLRMLALKGAAVERNAFEAELAANLRAERATAARLVDQAAAAGRIRSGSEVSLSEAGAALYARLWSQMSDVQARLYGDLPPDDLAVTKRVLAEVTRRATDMLLSAGQTS